MEKGEGAGWHWQGVVTAVTRIAGDRGRGVRQEGLLLWRGCGPHCSALDGLIRHCQRRPTSTTRARSLLYLPLSPCLLPSAYLSLPSATVFVLSSPLSSCSEQSFFLCLSAFYIFLLLFLSPHLSKSVPLACTHLLSALCMRMHLCASVGVCMCVSLPQAIPWEASQALEGKWGVSLLKKSKASVQIPGMARHSSAVNFHLINSRCVAEVSVQRVAGQHRTPAVVLLFSAASGELSKPFSA